MAACIAHPTYILAVNDTDHDPGWNTSSSPSLTGSLPISHPNRISHSHPAWCLALPSSFNAVRIAHAVLGGCAFLIFFPLGGTVMLVSRHPKAVYVHAALQTFAYLVSTIAAGLGIWMAKKVHSVSLFCTVFARQAKWPVQETWTDRCSPDERLSSYHWSCDTRSLWSAATQRTDKPLASFPAPTRRPSCPGTFVDWPGFDHGRHHQRRSWVPVCFDLSGPTAVECA